MKHSNRPRLGNTGILAAPLFILVLTLLVAGLAILIPSPGSAKRVSGADGFDLLSDCGLLSDGQIVSAIGVQACCSKEMHYCVVCVGSDSGSAQCELTPYRRNPLLGMTLPGGGGSENPGIASEGMQSFPGKDPSPPPNGTIEP